MLLNNLSIRLPTKYNTIPVRYSTCTATVNSNRSLYVNTVQIFKYWKCQAKESIQTKLLLTLPSGIV